MATTEENPLPQTDHGVITPHDASARAHNADGLLRFVARYGLVMFLVILIIVFSFLEPHTFATTTMATTILVQQSVILLVAIAVLPIVIVGEFDLSVGYILGLVGVVIAALGGEAHLSSLPVLLLTVIIAASITALSGILITILHVPSMIATLGIGLAVGGLTEGVSGGQTLVSGIPAIVPELSTTSLLGISSAVWIVLGICVVMYAVLAHTPTGRRMYAVGGSEIVARLAGIRTVRLKIVSFIAGGALIAVAGMLALGQSGGANPSFGPDLLLPAYAAVFLGSTTIRPGFFNVWGTIVATLVLAVGFTGLNLVGVPYWTQPVFNGCALIVGVLLSRGEVRRAGR
jgi:ribose transport system permease protein